MSGQPNAPHDVNGTGQRTEPGAHDTTEPAQAASAGRTKARPTPAVKRKRLSARLGMVLGTVAVLALTAGIVFLTLPKPPPLGAASDLPSTGLESWAQTSDRLGMSQGWKDLNEAMADGDREKFLSYAEPAAREGMARWWDGTKKVGWTLGFALPGARVDEKSNETVQQMTLGAQLAFSAHADRGSGLSASGLKLTQSYQYDVTYKVNEGDDLKIATFKPTADNWMPWDDGEIYVVKRPHVVLFGMASEKKLVDSTADVAEESAVIALDSLKKLGGTAPVKGFVAAITDDEKRFSRWYGPNQAAFDVAGIATQTLKPGSEVLELDPEIATGDGNSGMLVTMSPKSVNHRKETFVHEFGHVIHETAAPDEGAFSYNSEQKVEGFARYFENVAGVGSGYFTDPRTAQNILEKGDGALSDEIFNSKDAGLFYDAAGSYYQFVADSGGNAWDIALKWNGSESLISLGTEQNKKFSVENWQAWVREQTGG
ncbi:hypothetical protein JD292_00855 [Leucobacter sp. CSA2]|uniref:Uncharacterized protein n=1 Tax=Leucobacter edaphi TaxID=2796472 RepID=A0A934QAP5_9MICO|nr:hypothetical protein [Leucobacter edaphi]MBK0420628.1 hypothetical protein [Leucobacter edaphi]